MGNKAKYLILKSYFKELILVDSRQKLLTFTFAKPHIIFIDSDENNHDCLKLIKEVRQEDKKSMIIIMGKTIDKPFLLELLPLHVSAYLEKPFKKNDLEKTLVSLMHDFTEISVSNSIPLQNNYSFNVDELMLLNAEHQIVKLTKNEIKLMQLLTREKNTYVSSQSIEHHIWEEASFENDCNNRLKHLVYCLRKKLPKETLINTYGLGYKLMMH